MAEGTPTTLYGRVIVRATIEALTGLHIGGSTSALGIGGVDLPVVRDTLSGQPYLPGSSLRGKMRAQTEKVLGLSLNWPTTGRARIHSPRTRDEYDASPIGRLYGVPGNVPFAVEAPTRLVVRDVQLSEATRTSLENARTDLPYTELKAELAVDRVTAEALPRFVERLPAGSRLGPAELTYSVYESRDVADFSWVVRGLRLVEDDYLGGLGSRGSGKIRFADIQLQVRSRGSYRGEAENETSRSFDSLDSLVGSLASVEEWLRSALALPA